jgi:phage terminase small subunit
VARNPNTGLTDKQQRFCQEYLSDFNATQAYIRAGYAKKTARQAAQRLLTNVDIQAYLSHHINKAEDKSVASLQRTLNELAYVAYSRPTDVYSFSDSGLTLKNSDELPDEVLAAIESVTFIETVSESENSLTTTTKKSVKQHNKMAALNLLSKYFGMQDDFNTARAAMKRYGIAMVPSEESEVGWTLEKYDPNRSDS